MSLRKHRTNFLDLDRLIRQRWILIILLIIVISPASFGQDKYKIWCMKSCLPGWVHHSIRDHSLEDKYEVSFHINPFYQRGDFDGDSKPDYAVAIVNKESKKQGIALFHHPGNELFIIGAGIMFDDKIDDFKWMWIWKVVQRDTLKSTWEDHEAVLLGEALLCEKPESSNGYIYWTGEGYDWFHLSD